MDKNSNLVICEDLSSNNALPNLNAYWDAGHRVLFTKASESTTYTWKDAATLAKAWHKKGGIQGWYAFLRPGDGTAQADEFWSLVGPHLVNGDFVVADVEIEGVTMSIVKAFIDRVRVLLQRAKKYARGLIYGSPGFLRPKKIVSYDGWRLWQAQYGPKADVIPGFPGGWMLWQYTDRAVIAGSAHTVDASRMKTWCLQPVLREGDRNFAVLELKRGLKANGYKGIFMNMKYGRATARAVKAFKVSHALSPTDVAGPRVWDLLSK